MYLQRHEFVFDPPRYHEKTQIIQYISMYTYKRYSAKDIYTVSIKTHHTANRGTTNWKVGVRFAE